MRLLLDTCVLSEVRHPQGSTKVKGFVRACNDADLFVSVISIGELVRGISLLAESPRKSALSRWLNELEDHFADRILSIDTEAGRIWGEITALRQRAGRPLPTADGLIAATGVWHGLHIATRNTADFESTGALIIDPWS